MSWSDMCGMVTTKGTFVATNDLYGSNADPVRLWRAALPPAANLALMAAKAQGLKLKAVTSSGMAFHIVTCGITRGVLSTFQVSNEVVSAKQGARECYEDRLLPINTTVGHILVHQSLTPCERCRTGYSKWAQDRECTIVVSADGGYDQIPDNPIFFFSPNGTVFYG